MTKVQFGLSTLIVLVLILGLLLGIGVHLYQAYQCKVQYEAHRQQTIDTIRSLKNALAVYCSLNGDYPPTVSDKWPEANTLQGIELDARLLANTSGIVI